MMYPCQSSTKWKITHQGSCHIHKFACTNHLNEQVSLNSYIYLHLQGHKFISMDMEFYNFNSLLVSGLVASLSRFIINLIDFQSFYLLCVHKLMLDKGLNEVINLHDGQFSKKSLKRGIQIDLFWFLPF